MTATTETGLLMIPLAEIQPSTLNRQLSDDDPAIIALAESMRHEGLLQPIVVRPIPYTSAGHPQPGYEIVCGERRWRAARVLGWGSIPAIVRELSIEDAHVARLVENLQRQDVPPLEQSEGVAGLLRVHEGNAEEAAKRLGVSVSWVYLRAKLRNLSDRWRKELSDADTPYERLAASVTWQEQLAALPREVQDRLWERRELMHCTTIKEVRRRVASTMRLLASAPWKKKDEAKMRRPDGSRAAVCGQCAKRTDREPGLFAELVEMQPDKAGACCLDGDCWDAKRLAFAQLAARDLFARNPLAVALVGSSWAAPDWLRELGMRCLPRWSACDDQNESDGYIEKVDAVEVEGEDAGLVRTVWIDPTDVLDTSDHEFDDEGDASDPEDDEQEKSEQAERLIVTQARRDLEGRIRDEWPAPALAVDPDEPENLDCQLMTAAMLAAAVGTEGTGGDGYAILIESIGASREALLAALCDGIKSNISRALFYATADDIAAIGRLLGYRPRITTVGHSSQE